MVTSHDVARLAGVSQPTVSRALRGGAHVSAETRRRVQQAVRELGYVPSSAGRALSVGRSYRIGLHVSDLTNQFYPHVIAPLHAALEGLGYDLVLLTDSSRSPVDERAKALALDGIVLTMTTASSAEPRRLREREVPFVYFNRLGTRVEADAIVVDPSDGLRGAVRASAELGHRRAGALVGPWEASTAIERTALTRELMAQAGIDLPDEFVLSGGYDVASGRQGMERLLSAAEPPSVVFCGNDVVALGAFNEACARGLVVGRDISLVGFDDLPEAAWPAFGLSTIGYDLADMVRRAAHLMIERLTAGADEPYRRVVMASHFVHRPSLGPGPAHLPTT